MSTQPQIRHESETQRQHVRLPLPARVVIGGVEYETKDLSSGGVAVKGVTGEFKRGQKIPLGLRLPFGSFLLDAHFEAEVQHFNAKEKSIGCTFVNLSNEHISLLNYMLKAYLAGDLVTSGDLLGIVSRENFTKARKQPLILEKADFKKQIPGLLAIAAIGCVITAFVLGNLYSSLFVVKAQSAAVTASTAQLKAKAEGIFHSKLDPGATTVEQGQLIGEITPAGGGADVAVKSPCNCHVLTLNAADNDFVTEGGPLATLVPVNATPWVTAEVEPALAAKLKASTKATMTVFGAKTEFTGKIAGMTASMDTHAVSVRIVPDQKLPLNLASRPASVVFAVR